MRLAKFLIHLDVTIYSKDSFPSENTYFYKMLHLIDVSFQELARQKWQNKCRKNQ